jgi:hypothetical protein
MFAAVQAVRKALRGVKRDRSFANVDADLVPLAEYYELVGLDTQLAKEKGYDEAAAAIVKRKARH